MSTSYFYCGPCNLAWDDDWSCACDDECPKCGNDYTPFDSEEERDAAMQANTRFDPVTGAKVIYQDAADASEHRLRVMESTSPLELLGHDYSEGDQIEDGFDDESDFEEDDE